MVTSILAVIIKIRMRPYLPGVTLPDQCSAAPGRYMYESIHKVLSALHWAHTNDAHMIMILQDMRKAFDLLDRGYLRAVLLMLTGHQSEQDGQHEYNESGELTPAGRFIRWFDILLGTSDAPLTRRVQVNGEVDSETLSLHSWLWMTLPVLST